MEKNFNQQQTDCLRIVLFGPEAVEAVFYARPQDQDSGRDRAGGTGRDTQLCSRRTSNRARS